MGVLKIILYSVICGGYDRFWPLKPEPGLDCYIFTDLPNALIPEPWQPMPMPERENALRKQLDPRRWSRLVKLCPHRYLPTHDVSIYADANLAFEKPIRDWSLEQLARAEIAVHPHPHRQCTYAEARTCLELKFDYPATIQAHVAKLRAAGFPENLGLAENCFLIRRNSAAIQALNEFWLAEYLAGSQRDQLSFMFCLWSTRTPLAWIQQNSRRNPYYNQKRHLKDRCVK